MEQKEVEEGKAGSPLREVARRGQHPGGRPGIAMSFTSLDAQTPELWEEHQAIILPEPNTVIKQH